MADFLMVLGLVIAALLFILIMCGFRRNNQVYKFRMELVEWVHLGTLSDIDKDADWRWRFEALNTVSYWRMAFSFKPLKAENFYEDTTFLEVTP